MARDSPRSLVSASASSNLTPTQKSKTMRKGTHSCTECRRRKLRCELLPGALECYNCKSRRTPCVSQNGESQARLSLRRRPVSRPVSPIDSQSHSNGETPASDVLENSVTDQRAPFLAVLGPSGTSPSRVPEPLSGGTRGQSICETLRESLPSYDSIMKVAMAHNSWWVRIHRAVRGMHDDTIESFPDFVKRVYTSDQPSEVGKMAIALAFASDGDGSNIYSLVDRLVVSDTHVAHMCTVEGLECLILLAILYADEGQPRRSWMIFRRGVTVAQLTDLYHAGLRSMAKRRLWLAIYRGDRMMSLFLGLPYGFVDIHHQQILEVEPESDDFLDSTVTIRCAMIAGKLIDRNLSPKASVTKTFELDEEMNELAALFPATWWEQIPHRLQIDGHEFDEIHARLHQQLFFFHLRLYIYLPFLSSSDNSIHGPTMRIASMEAARQLLRRYLSLHSHMVGLLSPSECKLVDFMAFTGAVVLLLGQSSTFGSKMSSDWRGDDIEAVLALIRCLQVQKERENCPIASQCRKTLMVLLSRSTADEEVRIPFFGTVVRKGDSAVAVEENTQTCRGYTTNPMRDGSHILTAGSASLSTTVTESTPASENLPLPSSTIPDAPWDIPELGFLSHLEDVSVDFDAGWEFMMDLDNF